MSRKRSRYEQAIVERESEGEDESLNEEEDQAGSEGDEAADDDDAAGLGGPSTPQPKRQQQQLHVNLSNKALVCHVCGKSGHRAGFVGAVYVDCPNKPCYLCKQPGHTTATCPHNVAVGSSSIGPASGGGSSGSSALVQRLIQREHTGHQPRGALAQPKSPRWQVDAAILKLHSRRVCCLAFTPHSHSHVISGDKKGQVAIWNYEQVHERVLYSGLHRALVNSLKPSPWLTGGFDCASASSDGTVKVFDLETGCDQTLHNLNPDGWTPGCKWAMFYGMDTNQELHLILAGDSEGRLHCLDPRTQHPVNTLQLHKPGSKVNAVSVNPVGGARVVLTGGNDHTAKLFDIRKLSSVNTPAAATGSQPPLPPTPPAAAAAAAAAADSEPAATAATAATGRGRGRGGRGRSSSRTAAAAAAADSPPQPAAAGRGRGRGRGGSRTAAAATAATAATTAAAAAPSGRGKNSAAAMAAAAAAVAELACLPHGRVVNAAVFSPSGRKILTTCQDNRLRVWDNLLTCAGTPPSREIVHSHDFNRYLTPFKAEWFPSDPSESLILCGRYISEDFGGVALHPVDVIDAASGRLLAALVDGHLETITPVNLPHPTRDIIISGSSRSLYKWVPQSDEEDEYEEEEEEERDRDTRTHSKKTSGSLAAAAAAAAAAGGVVRRAGTSSTFMCVDADPQGGGRKGGSKTKKATTTTAAAATRNTQQTRKRGRRKSAKAADDDDEDDNEEQADSDDE